MFMKNRRDGNVLVLIQLKYFKMKHLYTIELGQTKKHLHCGIVRLFIEAFRLAFHSEDWRVSIRTFCHDELNGR